MSWPIKSKATTKLTYQCKVQSIETTTSDRSYRVFKGYVANAMADIKVHEGAFHSKNRKSSSNKDTTVNIHDNY